MKLKKRQVFKSNFLSDDFFQYTEYFTYFGRINYSDIYIRNFTDSVHGGGCIELNFENYDPIDKDFKVFFYFNQTSQLEEFKMKFPPQKFNEVIINVREKQENEFVESKYDIGKYKFFDPLYKPTIIKSNLAGRIYYRLRYIDEKIIVPVWVFLYILLSFIFILFDINFSSLLFSTLICVFFCVVKIISKETSTWIHI